MPLTASSPIEPPGKRIGLTTKLSVVIASCAPSIDTAPASPSAASAGEPKAGTSRPSISVCVALPPAPCAIVICVVLERAARLARAVSMIPRIALLAVGRRRPATQTTSRSRAKRP